MLRVSKYLLSAALASLFVLMVSNTVKAQTEISSVSEPVQVAFGAYILRISSVSPQEGSAEVDMWVWFRWKDVDIRPDLTFEITNGVITSRTESEPFLENDYNLASVRVQAKIFHGFDVNRFPLDNHMIHIRIEDASEPNVGLVFTADQDSALDSHVNIAGWAVALKARYGCTLCLQDQLRLAWCCIGPIAVWCRSFDHVMCSKGDKPWAQTERMNFARMRCGSR